MGRKGATKYEVIFEKVVVMVQKDCVRRLRNFRYAFFKSRLMRAHLNSTFRYDSLK